MASNIFQITVPNVDAEQNFIDIYGSNLFPSFEVLSTDNVTHTLPGENIWQNMNYIEQRVMVYWIIDDANILTALSTFQTFIQNYTFLFQPQSHYWPITA